MRLEHLWALGITVNQQYYLVCVRLNIYKLLELFKVTIKHFGRRIKFAKKKVQFSFIVFHYLWIFLS